MTLRSQSLLEELQWRGLVHQTTADDLLPGFLSTPGRVAYCGFDPTSDSLTIGNLVPIMMLAHIQRAGHKPIALMGGGTGLIGDPSGKDSERQLQTLEQVATNVETLSQAQPADFTCAAYHAVLAALRGTPAPNCSFVVPHRFIGTCSCTPAEAEAGAEQAVGLVEAGA